MENVRGLLDYIQKSPSCYQAVENAAEKLQAAGYRPLEETQCWQLQTGGRYYVVRNGSSLIAFQLPKHMPKGFHMIAAHSDSPCFKIKERPEMAVENRYVKLNAERYGGMILSAWLDRPLSVAGRLAVLKDGHIQGRNVVIDRDLMVIPNVAIHMNREMNKGVEYNAQTDMLPLFGGMEGETALVTLLAEEAGVEAQDILGMDLFVYNRERGTVLGAREEFILAPRLDDLACVYAALQAMLQAVPEEYINLMVIFDNEEVGSTTRQGAAASFLKDTLSGICEAMEWSQGDYRRLLADSFMISADNAHAVHPNHTEKADPTNRPYLNGGVVIKYHGSQKYTTDALTGARMKEICKRAGVPWQSYANRSDIAGGSTLGNISTTQVAVSTVDIGLAQLAMHSSSETVGARDVEYMIKAMRCFYTE